MSELLKPYIDNGLNLKNHIVMAPMTRSRAINNIPNELMAEYYGQRTGAGLIITEGTAPDENSLGYPRIPGIFNIEQVNGWKKVTEVVRYGGSRFFMQLMHTGRIGHNDNLPEGTRLVGPSDLKATGNIFTDSKGLQEFSSPEALSADGIADVIDGFVAAAKNAVKAGFDGIELHGANGYLLEQFLNPNVNNRTDQYGGSIVNRARLTIEIAEKVARHIGKDKVAIRISPYSTLGDLQSYPAEDVNETYRYLAAELDRIGIIYIHVAVNAAIPQNTFDGIRAAFSRTIILCNGLTPESGETALQNGFADLVAFGRSFLANPDFVARIELNSPLNAPRMQFAYTAGTEGYTDYPFI